MAIKDNNTNPLILFKTIGGDIYATAIPSEGFKGDKYFQIHCVGLDSGSLHAWLAKNKGDNGKPYQLVSNPLIIDCELSVDSDRNYNSSFEVTYKDGSVVINNNNTAQFDEIKLSGSKHQIQFYPQNFLVNAEHKYGDETLDISKGDKTIEWYIDPVTVTCGMQSSQDLLSLPWIERQDKDTGMVLLVSENTNAQRETYINYGFIPDDGSNTLIPIISGKGIKITQDTLKKVIINSFKLTNKSGLNDSTVIPVTVDYTTFNETEIPLCTMDKTNNEYIVSKNLGNGIDFIDFKIDDSNVQEGESDLGIDANNLTGSNWYCLFTFGWDETRGLINLDTIVKKTESNTIEIPLTIDSYEPDDDEKTEIINSTTTAEYSRKVDTGKFFVAVHHCYVNSSENTQYKWDSLFENNSTDELDAIARKIMEVMLSDEDLDTMKLHQLMIIPSVVELNYTTYFPRFSLHELQTASVSSQTVKSNGTVNSDTDFITTDMPYFTHLPSSEDISTDDADMDKIGNVNKINSYYKGPYKCKNEFTITASCISSATESNVKILDYQPLVVENAHAADALYKDENGDKNTFILTFGNGSNLEIYTCSECFPGMEKNSDGTDKWGSDAPPTTSTDDEGVTTKTSYQVLKPESKKFERNLYVKSLVKGKETTDAEGNTVATYTEKLFKKIVIYNKFEKDPNNYVHRTVREIISTEE